MRKMTAFQSRTQVQWGVPEELVSPMNWQTASFELSCIEHNLTPSSQLLTLTRAVKAIYSEFKHIVLPRLQAKGKDNIYIGADDLVPIFMYVFVNSKLKRPILNRELMWSMCHPDQLHGEAGYYLTVYESSIEYVLNEPLERDSFSLPCVDSVLSSSGNRSRSQSNTSVTSRRDTNGGDKKTKSCCNCLFKSFAPDNNLTMRESFH